MSRFLIEKDGEKQFVGSLKGYDGWKVLGTGKRFAPPEHRAEFINGKWITDETKAAHAARCATPIHELVERIECLEAAIAKSTSKGEVK
jgi:hypothetical protein